jgi:hypothetical protein
VVFNGARPDVGAIEARIREEYGKWCLASFFVMINLASQSLVPLLVRE